MKKILLAVMVLTVAMLFAVNAGAMQTPYTGETSETAGIGINGSVHDLSESGNQSQAYNVAGTDYLDRICIFCHAPHHTKKLAGVTDGSGEDNISGDPITAAAKFSYLPLWNHQFTERPDFDAYDNGTGPAAGPKASQAILSGTMSVGSVSLLCLSCHDGSRAVNTYGNPGQDSRSMADDDDTGLIIDMQYMIGGAAADNDNGILQNHHPIGFTWPALADDPEIYAPAAATLGSFTADQLLYDGKMECATCHAVHNTGNNGEKLLYESDSHSNLCLACHIKGTQQ